MDQGSVGALPYGLLPLDAPLAGLALALAAAAGYRLANISRWRQYGRLGTLGAGAALGAAAGLAMLPLALALPLRSAPLAATALEAALLPTLAALALDAATGLAAAAATAAALMLITLGAAWPAVLLLALTVGGGIALVRGELEPFCHWLDWEWARLRLSAVKLVAADRSPLDQSPFDPSTHSSLPDTGSAGPQAWRRAALGLIPALLVLPVLWAGKPVAAALAVLAIGLHVPALWAIRRLILGDGLSPAALPSGLIAGEKVDRTAIAPLLARIIAELPEGIAVFDEADRLLACNGQYRALNRDLSADLEPGAQYGELLRAELERREAADVEAELSDALNRHRNLPWRAEQPQRDGSWVQILEQRAADGATLRIMRDITATKQRELQFAELAQRNAVLASTVASVTSGIVICDATQPDQPIVFANAAFSRMTGYTAAEAIGRNCRFLQGRDTDREAVERVRRAIAVGRAVSVTLRNYRKDGRTFWNEINVSPLRDENGRLIHFVGILQDVTNRIRTEENLREAKNQAEVASRAKSEFVASVSHELRTPLNAILGFSEIMQLELFGALGAQYKGYAKDMHDSGQLLLDIINDILDLSKIEAGRMEVFPEPVPAGEAFAYCLHLVAGRAQSGGVALQSDLAQNLPLLFVDRRAIRQILNNLLSNAIKFTPKGGRVVLSAHPAEGNAVNITVADTGIGIAAKDISKVLEPFGQADNAHSRRQQGTGLGLPIVKALVELSGGTFRLESEPGRGTSVTIRLPAATSGAAVAAS